MDGPRDLLLTVYRAARERPIDDFQAFTLRLLKPLLQFDTAVWGAGALLEPGLAVHLAHLHEIPPEYFGEYESLNAEDPIIPIVTADPGRTKLFHAPTLFPGRKNAAVLDFSKRAGWQMIMCTAFRAHGQKAIQWMSLYRPDADEHYSDREQRVAQFLMPHLVEALTINRALGLHDVYDADPTLNRAFALCDRKGLLHYADPAFVAALGYEWPSFDGGTLPGELLTQCVRDRRPCFVGRRIRVEVRNRVDLVFLRATMASRLDHLSPREKRIAHLFGRGNSHKDIARVLCISPVTVRHHLSHVYAKLDIHDKAQLVCALGDRGDEIKA